MKFKRARIYVALLLVVMAAVLITTNAIWRDYVQREQIQREMLETTEVLATEMDAIWDFMELNQIQFKRHEDGTYNLYCVVAAKAVAKIFTNRSGDFTIHYTNLTTRKIDDVPDAFETEAMQALLDEPQRGSYYGLVEEDDGTSIFRYVEPLYYKESCLECHGDPAGELDMMGYPKEGKKVDDLAGAASIIMPADTYLANLRTNVIQETIVFSILVLLGLAAVFWAVTVVANAQVRRLEEENQVKSDFLAMVSHEIRTPLTSILAFSDIWAKSHKPRNPDEAKIMDEMRIHSQKLLSMVNNMLEMARVEAGRLNPTPEPMDVSDLLGRVRDNLSYLAEKYQTNIYYATERGIPVLMADQEMLRKIMENLISNAIKFVDVDGQVDVRISFDRSTGLLSMVVSDNGPGIEPQDLPTVFDRFVQGKSFGKAQDGNGEQRPRDRISGSGLGLALVKELAELHGGSVKVESIVGQGSTFTVYIRADVLELEDEDPDS